MFTRSSQCVHLTDACWAGVMPGAVPKCGFSASGERPRQPLMHSSDPGTGMYGMNGAYGLGIVVDAFRPSISERLSHVRHAESGFAIALASAQRSSSSQSPMWMVCVTMSGYEYCGM